MSSDARPIAPSAFRLAIHDLPISNLHTKAAELRNSIAHLVSSNAQLKEFADAGDEDCADAIRENGIVMERMEGRMQMLREEVEGRGMRWVEDGEGAWEGKPVNGVGPALEPGEEANGDAHTDGAGNGNGATSVVPQQQGSGSGRLTDEQLRLLLADRMGLPDGQGEEEEDEGVHL